MPTTPVLARGWAFEINTGTEALPTWTEIGGLTSWSDGGDDATETDTTDFQSDGWTEHLVAGRSAGTISFEGHYEVDPATDARDAGQAAVEAAAELIDYDSIKGFRMFHVGTGKGLAGVATFRRGSKGGGNNDKTTWGASARWNGKPAVYTAA